jgi:hypothetical protein
VPTPYDPMLFIYDLDENLIGMSTYTYSDGDYFYWSVTIDATNFAAKTNYKFIIDDLLMTGFDAQTYFLYVNDDYNAEAYITRALGLSGFNCRYYSYAWTNGLLTGFKIRIYATKAALEAAEAGGTDVYLASYTVAIAYDANYNPYQITSIKD